MLYIIEGSQGVGKTTLINASVLREKYYHFSFSEHMSALGINNPHDVWNFTIGKDLQILEYTKAFREKLFVIDRCFLSTIVYADLMNRAMKQEIANYINHLHKFELLKHVKLFYISGLKPEFKRNHGDAWDKLYDIRQAQDKLYNYYIDIFEKEQMVEIVKVFNKFDEDTIYEFSRLVSVEDYQ